VRKLPALAILALAAACNSSGTGVLANLLGPQSVVAFMGKSPEYTGTLMPLLAVTAPRGDELRIIDPQADLPVRSPAIYAPLGVPTAPRPLFLASASLADGQADVLVVASASTLIQQIATWLDGVNPQAYGVIAEWDLVGITGTGSQILSMVGAAVPGAPASAQPPVFSARPGVARVIVGLTGGTDGLGGRLAVLDFSRNADGSVSLVGTPTVKVLGFDPVALAASPDRIHLYVASTDTITDSDGLQVLGIAEVDVSAPDARDWTVRGLDGRAPTIAVGAAILGERLASSTMDFGPPQLRVYAVIGSGPSTGISPLAGASTTVGCGINARIGCGVATFDPARGGLAADPAPPPSPIGPQVPRQPYRAPLYLPTTPLSMAVGLPAASGDSQCSDTTTCPPGVNFLGVQQPLAVIPLSSWDEWTTGMAGVPSGDGSVIVEDLGRYGPPDTSLLLDSNLTRTQVTGAFSAPPAASPNGNYIALYEPPGLGAEPPSGAGIAYLATDLINSIIVWPGFTPTDSWTLIWQGALPSLGLFDGVVGELAPGVGPCGSASNVNCLYLAVQQPVNIPPTGPGDWVVGAFVSAPELAIHAADTSPPGDLALFFPADDASGCQGTPQPGSTLPAYEWTVSSILPPDPVNYPGGAVALSPANSLAVCLLSYLALPQTQFGPGSFMPVSGSLRASGLILSSSSLGYAGRPQLGARFNLAWQPEDGLSGEELILARKARRLFYPGGPYAAPNLGNPCPGNIACYPGYPEMTDPMQPGPVIGFRPGVACPSGPCPAGSLPARDSALTFQTASGMTPFQARPTNVSTASGVAAFDKSYFTDSTSQVLGEVFYITYTGDVLFMVPPAGIGSQKTIR